MNRLSSETSPYLLQHKHNPVHWRAWSEDVLRDARQADKPVLLSIGYAACHWCHVMAHESFEDPEIARAMNDLFINVKVDREERPDIDAIYQSALALLGEQGGWPLTMFLTPEGEPFWGGTYFPPEPRYGRPGFGDVLRAISDVYHNDPSRIRTNVQALRDGLRRLSSPQSGPGLTLAMLDQAAAAAVRLVDPALGGTAGAPKFPQPVFFRFLWRAYKRSRAEMYRDAVLTTLQHMCQGGIYDHVGGGFARYATDSRWLVPHFEKMLYDNALLVDLMTEVWLDTRDPLLAVRIAETISWCLADLRVDDPSGSDFAFAGAYDADSEGVEGKYYVWSEAEIDDLLGSDAALFKAAYDVSRRGNWEGHTILNRSHAPALRSEADEETLRRCRQVLLEARRKRVPPLRDDKVLADWNGLMIAALTRAAAVFDQPAWRDAAEAAFRFISRNLSAGERLLHAWCAGSSRHPAVIEDYASMALAAVALFETTGRRDYLAHAEHWAAIADRYYWDPMDGGYFQSADDTTDVFTRAKTIADHATPSGNTTMLEVLARLYHLTGNQHYRARCDAMIVLFSGNNPQYLIAVPGLLTNFELLERGVQVVIVGDRDDAQAAALRRAAVRAPTPLKIIMPISSGAEDLPSSHPAKGKGMVDGRATAYVCIGSTCGLPITEPEVLLQHLDHQ
ncbi:MAG: thioredoxin domain-containing protein [Rhodospirillales bacterium]|nr:thioredoxin domain-containing protein [Rhodospirillales bacterium]